MARTRFQVGSRAGKVNLTSKLLDGLLSQGGWEVIDVESFHNGFFQYRAHSRARRS
jgi:hypothetical protein